METAALQTTWLALTTRYRVTETAARQELDRLLAHYAGPGRHYHTTRHLFALLSLQNAYAALLHDNEVVQLSIFYHDMIYDVRRPDNEEQSAQAAAAFLQHTAFPAARQALVAQYIRATRTHINDTGDTDLDHFLDFDLSILGSPPAAYQAYTQQIRQEYAVYPNSAYYAGRKRVLEHFLQRPSIYKTPVFREKYEAQARENIREELLRIAAASA